MAKRRYLWLRIFVVYWTGSSVSIPYGFDSKVQWRRRRTKQTPKTVTWDSQNSRHGVVDITVRQYLTYLSVRRILSFVEGTLFRGSDIRELEVWMDRQTYNVSSNTDRSRRGGKTVLKRFPWPPSSDPLHRPSRSALTCDKVIALDYF